MSDKPAGGRGGFGRGRGRGKDDRGGRGGRRGRRRFPKREDKDVWVPVTKLGRLVQAGRIKQLEEVYRFSLPVKEHQIVEFFLKDLQDVVRVLPLRAGVTPHLTRRPPPSRCLVPGHEDHAGAEADHRRSAHALQGVRCRG